ncbi:MAG TPA: hypothetical protein VMW43_06045 [Bacteroidota bacterium]|nr:hypothetical protein [Bacteroidota bacterium]
MNGTDEPEGRSEIERIRRRHAPVNGTKVYRLSDVRNFFYFSLDFLSATVYISNQCHKIWETIRVIVIPPSHGMIIRMDLLEVTTPRRKFD